MQADVMKQLQSDHHRIRVLIEELGEMTNDAVADRRRGLKMLRRELLPHFRAEEHVFYTALEKVRPAPDSLIDAREDHAVTEVFLDELDTLDASNGAWAVRLMALREMVEHHFHQEESAFSDADELFLGVADHDASLRLLEAKKHALCGCD